jgi:hypothetical protein
MIVVRARVVHATSVGVRAAFDGFRPGSTPGFDQQNLRAEQSFRRPCVPGGWLSERRQRTVGVFARDDVPPWTPPRPGVKAEFGRPLPTLAGAVGPISFRCALLSARMRWRQHNFNQHPAPWGRNVRVSFHRRGSTHVGVGDSVHTTPAMEIRTVASSATPRRLVARVRRSTSGTARADPRDRRPARCARSVSHPGRHQLAEPSPSAPCRRSAGSDRVVHHSGRLAAHRQLGGSVQPPTPHRSAGYGRRRRRSGHEPCGQSRMPRAARRHLRHRTRPRGGDNSSPQQLDGNVTVTITDVGPPHNRQPAR